MLSLLLATTLAAFTPAQPGEPASFDVMALTVFVLDDRALARELDLKEDQLKALQAHRKQWLEDHQKLPIEQRYGPKRGEFSESNDKALARILTDKQLPLLRKRLLWEACFRFGEFRALRYAEVVKGLGLTNEQTGKLGMGEAAADVLTGDQKKKWDEMRGPRPVAMLKVTPSPENRSASTEVNPEHLMLLVLPAVQQELKLNDKQKGVVQEQEKKWIKEAPALIFGKPEPLKTLVDAIEKAVGEALDEGQRKRLNQLQRQKKIRHAIGNFWTAAFNDPAFQKEIGLTSEQKHKVENLDAAILKDVVKAASKAEEAADLILAVRTVAAAHQKALLDRLEPEQKKKVEELYGEPFERRLPIVNRTSLLEDEYPPARPPVLDLLQDVNNEVISKELKLSKEKQDQLSKLFVEVQSAPARGDTPADQRENRQKVYAELVMKMEAALGKEGFQRAKEIVVQLIVDAPDSFYEYRSAILAHWPEVVAQ